MNIDILERIGLNKKEAITYLKLLKLGKTTATALSKETGIERTLIYKTLESLISKGLATYITENKRRYFSAVSPRKLLIELKERENELKKIIPELIALSKLPKEKETKIEIYRDKSGIKSMIREILELKQDYVVAGGKGEFSESFSFFNRYMMKKLEKLGIKERVLISSDIKFRIKSKNTILKRLPKGYPSPATFGVMGNKLGMIVWSEPFLGITIENEDLAKTFKNFFEILWKQSKS